MNTKEILLTAGVGLVASLVTAVATNVFARRQERRKNEREIAAKLADLRSTKDDVTRFVASQFAQACLVVERGGNAERERVFIPSGCRISLGSSPDNNIVMKDRVISKQHATFHAQGMNVYVEPLAPTSGVTVNGKRIQEPKRLSNGDSVSVAGASFKITFVTMIS
jgi:hypothetical protein